MKRIHLAAAALVAMLTGIQSGVAATFTVSSVAAFNADTTGAVTTDFNGVTGLDFGDATCPGSGACYAGFAPLQVSGITFGTTGGNTVNVNSPHYYGPTDLPNQYVVNAATHTLTITLPSAVTAFGLDYGTLFDVSTADFLLSNGYAKNNIPTLGSLATQFLGFISTTPFDSITLSVPNSFVVADVTTAVANTPLPATLPLMISALGGLGMIGYRRRRKTNAI